MKTVILRHRKPAEIMDIVKAMRSQGMVQGEDFDFAYNQARYDNDGWQAVEAEHTVFTFYEEKWATWFSLKWA